ncbi:Na(+)/H(+) antiporter subunit B [Clostridium sp. DL1XJH146]
MLKIFLILAIIFAYSAINAKKMRVSIILMGIFSLVSSFCYLLYSAPDVAIAEAIMGCTLSTILFLVALQKYKIFSIYYLVEGEKHQPEKIKRRENIIGLIEKFCSKKELETHVIYTSEKVEHIKDEHDYDLIVVQNGNDLTIYCNEDNYLIEGLEDFICFECDSELHLVVDKIKEEEVLNEN